MAGRAGRNRALDSHKAARTFTLLTASLASAACAQLGGPDGALYLDALVPGTQVADAASRGEAEHSAERLAKAYSEKPGDADTALAYALSLKEAGQKPKALAVLQEAYAQHSADRRLASEYGRLALELDQVIVAKKLLEFADDPSAPDWRIILARGTVLAKEGKYREAVDYFARALVLAPDHPSVLNNLALAYTMTGEPGKAEELLRRAAAGGGSAKVRQNLALVLSLQGKYEEAKKIGAEGGGAEAAEANAELVRKMVKGDPKLSADAEALDAAWETQLGEPIPAKTAPKATAREIKSASSDSRGEKVAEAASDPLFKPSQR